MIKISSNFTSCNISDALYSYIFINVFFYFCPFHRLALSPILDYKRMLSSTALTGLKSSQPNVTVNTWPPLSSHRAKKVTVVNLYTEVENRALSSFTDTTSNHWKKLGSQLKHRRWSNMKLWTLSWHTQRTLSIQTAPSSHPQKAE